MSVKYIIDHIPKNTAYNRRPGYSMAATTITIHNTGNVSSSAKGERGNLTNPANARTASFHIVVDEHGAIECIPLNENAWHAGDGSGVASGNRTSIGIEICESGDYAKTLDSVVQLVADMLRERGWGVDRLRRHYDWSGKICPRLMYNSGSWADWQEFKQRVVDKMEEGEPMTAEERKEMDDLKKQVRKQNEEIEAQAKALAAAVGRIEAPTWFVQEFGSDDLGGLMSEPVATKEGWRNIALSLRAQGFGNGRGKCVDIK